MKDEVQQHSGSYKGKRCEAEDAHDAGTVKRQCIRTFEDIDSVDDVKTSASLRDVKRCFMCGGALGTQDWLPHVRAPFLRKLAKEADGVTQESRVVEEKLCHFWCVCKAMEGTDWAHWDIDASGTCEHARSAMSLSQDYLDGVRKLLALSPELKSAEPRFRVALEEYRLRAAARCSEWPLALKLPGSLPTVSWAFDLLVEFRISSCPFITTLPPEIGLCSGLKKLVMISNSLVDVPKEIGNLLELQHVYLNGNFLRSIPDEVGQLPVLQELCADSNQIMSLPAFCSPCLELVSAPANRLVSLPKLSGWPQRLELHGNELATLDFQQSRSTVYLKSMLALKLMGNKLTSLPTELQWMTNLRVINVCENRLTELPDTLTGLFALQWIFAYGNSITHLPKHFLGGRWLERVLLEANPLRPEVTLALLREAAEAKVRMVGLDDEQVRSALRHCAIEGGNPPQLPLPECISVGQVVRVPDGCGQYFLKLTRASHLRRFGAQPALGERFADDGFDCSQQPQLLVVAFAASQGEPEWNGLLRRLAASGIVAAQRVPLGTLADLLGEDISPDKDLCVERLWSRCVGAVEVRPHELGQKDTLALEDFDVLNVVDHRMRWYSEEEASLHDVLRKIVQRYSKTLFVGASMGGFGALLHGGHLADGIVAFGPQSELSQATLRPPGAHIAALKELEVKLQASVLAARARGSLVHVHCAADEHFWHALALPLDDLALTVHPLLPRKPFARLLNNAGLLQPIIADALYTVIAPRPDPKERSEPLEDRSGVMVVLQNSELAIASWTQEGRFDRYRASRLDALKLFFGAESPSNMPRPGDWFCPKCGKWNAADAFFCYLCGTADVDASCINSSAARVTGGKKYPIKGDWGCRKCGMARCGYDKTCKICGSAKDSEHAFVFQ